MGAPRIVRGSDLKVYINGQLYAVATSIRWQINNGRHSIMGIDKITPFELAPGASTISGTIDCERLRQDGGLEGYGITAPQKKMMLEKYFSLAVIDRSTDTVILAIEQAAVGTQNWQVKAKGNVEGSFSFEGMQWESDLETGF